MTKFNGVFVFFLAGALGCGGSGLQAAGDGGPGGTGGDAGALGFGGSGQGGAGLGGELAGGGAGGGQTSGGNGAGGAIASGGHASGTGGSHADGGRTSLGGRGGANTGGSTRLGGRGGTNAGGAGGTTCPPVACSTIPCLYGELPNPDPCGCPICAPPDAGARNDAAPDACLALPCAYPICAPGYVVQTPPCGCPTCVPVDGGPADGIACGPCPAIKCQYPGEPGVDICGCPTCPPPPDAGTDAARIACVDLDACACFQANGCGVIAEACYCPFPQCSSSGACICGGGKFIGCAPVALTTCAAAKARVAALCPEFSGSAFDTLCAPSDTGCAAKCLNAVTACSDMSCYTCKDCKCKPDPFATCLDECTRALAQ